MTVAALARSRSDSNLSVTNKRVKDCGSHGRGGRVWRQHTFGNVRVEPV